MTTTMPAPTASAPITPRPRGHRHVNWAIAGLLALGMVPLTLGLAHLATVIVGIDVSAKALYFVRMPLPIAMHVIGATIYVLLGPLQFSTELRRRAPYLHRASGRVLVFAGLVVAISALWMTLTLPHQPRGGDLLYVARLLFGTAMIVFIGLGFVAIRRRNVPLHRRWMTRAYAIGLGAGTQIPLLMVAQIVLAGPPDELTRALLMTSAWLLNLGVAEWAVRRSRAAATQQGTST